jgi:hypothetical protein
VAYSPDVPSSPDANSPSVDDVIQILIDEMQRGSALPVSDDGLQFLTTYRKSFEQRLQDPTNWPREGGAVRHAARQLGVIASAIAALEREVEVTRQMIDHAAYVVEAHCAIGVEPPFGRWCSRDPEPDPAT